MITKIDAGVLHNRTALKTVPVGRRMSWAAHRQTSRPEDIAYCLLGLFDVNMPVIYGEGQKAFTRLQEEIIKTNNDLSIFLWRSPPGSKCRGFLAESPSEFACASTIQPSVSGTQVPEFTLTNKGLCVDMLLQEEGNGTCIMNLGYSYQDSIAHDSIGIWVQRRANGTLARMHPDRFATPSNQTDLPSHLLTNPLSKHSRPKFYLSKEESDDELEKAHESNSGDFYFEGHFTGQHYEHLSTTPATLWDNVTRHYRRKDGRPFAAFHVFQADAPFVVAFGVAHDETPWIALGMPTKDRASPEAMLLKAALKGDLESVGVQGFEMSKMPSRLPRGRFRTETNKDKGITTNVCLEVERTDAGFQTCRVTMTPTELSLVGKIICFLIVFAFGLLPVSVGLAFVFWVANRPR